MKTRSTPVEPPNIAASVKARRTARIGSPSYRSQSDVQSEDSILQVISTSINEKVDEPQPKSRQAGPKVPLKDVWTADDRRLFFQGVRLYGRNFNELARFIRSRGHRTDASATSATANPSSASAEASGVNSQSNAPTVVAPVSAAAGLLPSNFPNQSGVQLAGVEGRTKEQVRLFYQKTWHKLRRYIKYPDDVSQHVREVYAIINWSAMRFRIKKSLDNRLGEKLNELVHYGSTCVKHNGRRFLLRTPVCPVLKQLNHISVPTQEFTLPDDVWVELVPATQVVAWRVLEAEQNPRLRLKTDINRQLSDIISLAEAKWILPTDLIRSLLCPPGKPKPEESGKVPPKLLLRFQKEQRLDGAISLQEVSRTRSTDVALNAYLARRWITSGDSKSIPGDEAASEVAATATDNINSSAATGTTTAVTKASVQEEQRHVGSTRTGGSGPSTNSTAVHLDLREVGRQLAKGVTFEEARGIKLVVIFLALGCPARIRFEYDFVQSGPVRTSAFSSYMPSLSKEAIANGEGITNGLRRLLHLSASEYLNLKSWKRPVRPTLATTTATTATSSHVIKKKATPDKLPATTRSNAVASASSSVAGSSTLLPVQTAMPKSSEFAMPTCRVPGGHEIFVVNDGQKRRGKMVVARQLNVQRPVAPLASSVGDAGLTSPYQSLTPRPILPLPMPKVPIPALHSLAGAATGSLPVCKSAAPSLPINSLHALRTFSQNQARRMRKDRMALSALRRNRVAPVPTSLANAPPVQPLPSSSSAALQSIPSHTTGGVVGVATTSASQSNQGEPSISLPFSIDAYSNVSATDSLKSLLNAFMANAPPGLDLTTPTKDVPHLSSPNFLHFTPDAQATTDAVHQEDSSSFSTFIKTLTANHSSVSHPLEAPPSNDSFEEKIYQDMLQSTGDPVLHLPFCSEYPGSSAGDTNRSISPLNKIMHSESGTVQVDVVPAIPQEQYRQQQQQQPPPPPQGGTAGQTIQTSPDQPTRDHLSIGFIGHL